MKFQAHARLRAAKGCPTKKSEKHEERYAEHKMLQIYGRKCTRSNIAGNVRGAYILQHQIHGITTKCVMRVHNKDRTQDMYNKAIKK
jgi:hypothetical protein